MIPIVSYLRTMEKLCRGEDDQNRAKYRQAIEDRMPGRPSNVTILYTIIDCLVNAGLSLSRSYYDKELYQLFVIVLGIEGMNSFFSLQHFLHFECPNQKPEKIQQMMQ